MIKNNLAKFYNKEDYVFIFNKDQKNFYLNYGVKIVDSDVNATTGRMFWIFEKKDTEKLYTEWIEQGKNKAHK